MKFRTLLSHRRTFLTLLGIGVILYLSVERFPGAYHTIGSGLDPSWRYGLNVVARSNHLFGRDVVFTYGPLGYLLNPVNIGSNVAQALTLRLLLHGILIGVLFYYLLKRRKALPVIIFVAAYLVASNIGTGFSEDEYEYSFVLITGLLCCLSEVEDSRRSLIIDALNGLLASSFLFMKLTTGISSLAIIMVSLAVRLIRKEPAARRTALATAGAYLATTIVIITVYFKTPTNFLGWLGKSLELVDGYSIAMSLVGPPEFLIQALIALATFFCVVFLLYKCKSRSLHIALALLVPVFLSFKHGFVRQDEHMLLFYPFLLVAIGILVLNSEDRRELTLDGISLLVVLIFAIPMVRASHFLAATRLRDKLFAAEGLRNLSYLSHLDATRIGLDWQSNQNLKVDRLPAEWTRLIDANHGNVSTLPWEVSYCAANNLSYDPFPTLQMYVAYKSSLDQWSAMHYRGNRAPGFLLVEFPELDGRNLVLDTPETWRAILQNYEVIQKETPSGIHLLQKRMQGDSEDLTVIGEERGELFKWITVPAADGLLYACIDMRLRGIGWLSKAAFRIPPVQITLSFASGSLRQYRIIPDTATGGLLINHPPGNMEELDRLFAHTAADRVVRFRIDGPGAYYYSKTVKLVWKEEQKYKVFES
jgi:hypothetical protein